MRRQTRTFSTRIFVFLLAAVAALSAAAAGVGETGPQLLRQAVHLRAQDAALAEDEHSVLLDLYALESRLGAARVRLSALRREAASLARQRATARAELRAARRSLATAARRIATQLRLLYEEDSSTSALAVVLGASSLDEAITRLDDLDRTARQNRSVAAKMRAARAELTVLERKLRRRQERVGELAAAATATALSLERAQLERQAYLQQLGARRALGARQVAGLEARAQAAERRARVLALHVAPAPPPAPSLPVPAPEPASAPAAPLASGGGALAVSSTGYSLTGATATGVPVGWGVAAVDPSVIPLGTRFFVPGYGRVVAADTGPAVRGAEIDLWFPTPAQALAWGRRAVTVTFG